MQRNVNESRTPPKKHYSSESWRWQAVQTDFLSLHVQLAFGMGKKKRVANVCSRCEMRRHALVLVACTATHFRCRPHFLILFYIILFFVCPRRCTMRFILRKDCVSFDEGEHTYSVKAGSDAGYGRNFALPGDEKEQKIKSHRKRSLK